MRRSLHPGSRLFRSLLVLALLALATLTLGAFAHPLSMAGEMAGKVAMTMSTAHGSCRGMAMAMVHAHGARVSHPAQLHPTGDGHACCQQGGCHCATSCNGIVGVPFLGMTWQPAQHPTPRLLQTQAAPVHAGPPLRPPIV